MTPFEITALITVLANVIAENLNDEQLGFVSAVFDQLGDTLDTIALQRANLENTNGKQKNKENVELI